MKLFVNDINHLSKEEVKLMDFLNSYNITYDVDNYCNLSADEFIRILRESHGYDEIIRTKKKYDHMTQHEVYAKIRCRRLRLRTPIAIEKDKVTFGLRQKRRWIPRTARKIEQLETCIKAALELGVGSDEAYDTKVERELLAVESQVN